MKNENVISYNEIEKIGHGRSNEVYKIGNKVLKLGKAKMRLTLKFPNNPYIIHPYIIQPLLRKILTFGNDEIIVELAEYVPTFKPTDKKKKKIYI